MAVSPASEAKLRAAMTRLLAGQPQHTDGALTKENLAREAGVSHATVHRATDILTEWNAHVPHPVRRTPSERARDDTITTLRTQLAQIRDHARELQGQLDALASITANLYAENLALRRRLPGSVPSQAPGDANGTARRVAPL
jgi:small-conductance mechanosensitive channel